MVAVFSEAGEKRGAGQRANVVEDMRRDSCDGAEEGNDAAPESRAEFALVPG